MAFIQNWKQLLLPWLGGTRPHRWHVFTRRDLRRRGRRRVYLLALAVILKIGTISRLPHGTHLKVCFVFPCTLQSFPSKIEEITSLSYWNEGIATIWDFFWWTFLSYLNKLISSDISGHIDTCIDTCIDTFVSWLDDFLTLTALTAWPLDLLTWHRWHPCRSLLKLFNHQESSQSSRNWPPDLSSPKVIKRNGPSKVSFYELRQNLANYVS